MAAKQSGPARAVVSLVAEDDRYAAVHRALAALGPALPRRLRRAKKVLVKPNFVSCRHPLSATDVDATRAVLDYIRPYVSGEVFIGEGPALGEAGEGFDAYGYRPLAEEYGVPLVDLNGAAAVPFQVFREDFGPLTVRLSRPVLESDFRIAVGPPKTHDTVLVTLSVKNLAMGAVMRTVKGLGAGNDKWAMHQGWAATNVNLFLVARAVWPQLGVVDGHTAMEGEGPIFGTAARWHFAAASLDALALDFTVCGMMGVAPADVGYLYYCGRAGLGKFSEEEIGVVGRTPASLQRKLRLHSTAAEQRNWRVSEEELRRLGLFRG